MSTAAANKMILWQFFTPDISDLPVILILGKNDEYIPVFTGSDKSGMHRTKSRKQEYFTCYVSSTCMNGKSFSNFIYSLMFIFQ